MTDQPPIVLDPQHLRAVVDAATPSHWIPGDRPGEHAPVPIRNAELGIPVAKALSAYDATFIATFDPVTVRALLDLAFPPQAAPHNNEKVEWAADYQDGTPPRLGGDAFTSSEDMRWVAGNWVTDWNRHRDSDDKPAQLVRRTVTTTDWEPAVG